MSDSHYCPTSIAVHDVVSATAQTFHLVESDCDVLNLYFTKKDGEGVRITLYVDSGQADAMLRGLVPKDEGTTEAESAALVALRAVEWGGQATWCARCCEDKSTCPACVALSCEKHASDCFLAAAIAKAEGREVAL